MDDKYEWVIGRQVSFLPIEAESDSERVTGTVLEVRDDSPWPDEEQYRMVIDGPERIYDVAKNRVELE